MFITPTEKLDIVKHLEGSHALFRAFWDLGEPTFTKKIPTAAIQFDSKGDFLEFLFNEDFWVKLNSYDRAFVSAHEFLHVIFNHGKRINEKGADHEIANKAMDICVNQSLVNDFGFDRKLLQVEQAIGGPLCWIDTVFGADYKAKGVEDNREAEYYYNLLIQNRKDSVAIPGNVLDSHMTGDEMGKVCNYVKKNVMNKMDQYIQGIIDQLCENVLAGDGGGDWHTIKYCPVKLLKKWETVLNQWNLMKYKEDIFTVESFIRKNRRFEEILGDDCLLPSEINIEEKMLDKDAIAIYMFLDTSGSCFHLKDKFFAAYKTFNKYKFKIKLFAFDTKVHEIDPVTMKIYGGGGTRFDIIENQIQKCLKEDDTIRYPYTMVVTDGYGSNVNPEYPEKWYWFLTEQHSIQNIPKQSKVCQMKEFIG